MPLRHSILALLLTLPTVSGTWASPFESEATPPAPTSRRPAELPSRTPPTADRAQALLPLLREGKAAQAWEATGSWAGRREGQSISPEQRRFQAVRAALYLRDTGHFREGAALAHEIDQHLAAVQETASRAETRSDEAAVRDLRASLAAGFAMDTESAREHRLRSDQLAPERRPKRVPPRILPGSGNGEKGGRP